jgi:hypothetical protein
MVVKLSPNLSSGFREGPVTFEYTISQYRTGGCPDSREETALGSSVNRGNGSILPGG